MKIKSLFIVLCACTLFSCSKDSVDEPIVANASLNYSDSICNNSNMLSFATENDFANAIDELDSVEEQNRSEWVEQKFGTIVSLKDIYDEAMNVAEQLDESSVAYESYRKKYEKSLFFCKL